MLKDSVLALPRQCGGGRPVVPPSALTNNAAAHRRCIERGKPQPVDRQCRDAQVGWCVLPPSMPKPPVTVL